jgi:lipopolysaccharide transport system ATP-binding protein
MSDIAIRAEGLGKQYRIGQRQRGYKRFTETVTDTLMAPFRRLGRSGRAPSPDEMIWALKDVSFEVKQGEAIGIIGRNGAGKSTLLKILSRITEPTEGRAELHGRVASLLEIGTGFHPELTGRENIYLSGTIMGMNRAEIQRKFDEIVDFSGVAQFLNTPVKRYSSGMHVRLAFAVAAYLEPEILLVDEVLAVGDAEFQKKCLGKMDEVAGGGRTVLFVSHNLGMIVSLCPRAILLDSGLVSMDSLSSDVVTNYYTLGSSSSYSIDFRRQSRKIGDQFATLLDAHIEDEQGNHVGELDIRSPFRVQMTYALHTATPQPPYPNFHFYNTLGVCVFVTSGGRGYRAEKGLYQATCCIPGNFLNNDTYSVGLALTFTHSGSHVSFYEQAALLVTIRDPIDETLEETRSGYSGTIPGAVRPKLDWLIRRI